VTDGRGLPLAVHVTAGQRQESPKFESVMNAVRVAQPLGRPRTRPPLTALEFFHFELEGSEKAPMHKDDRFSTQAIKLCTVTITNDDTLGHDVDFILYNTRDVPINVTSSDALMRENGSALWVKKIDSSPDHCTMTRAGSETIEGATSMALSARYWHRMLGPGSADLWLVFGSL
jgi:hypothetical protein